MEIQRDGRLPPRAGANASRAALGEAENAHFEDEVRGGEVVFDYRLRPGVVTHSNALALMRAVGLEL